jgi:hypothetical protein
MKIKDKYYYIGCIPVEACPSHPPDQIDCIIEKCPECKDDMWVSKKKRLKRESMPKLVKVYCLKCLVLSAKKQGFDVEIFDFAVEH